MTLKLHSSLKQIGNWYITNHRKAPAAQPKVVDEVKGLKAQIRKLTKLEFEQIIDELNAENPQ